ncbi:MAG: TonB-dependent receptor plug domain-containing protein [Bacteroidia bacterium]
MHTTKRSFLILALFSALRAQSQIADTIQLDEVLVQDNRYPVKFAESMRAISIITAEEIATMPALTVPEILSYSTSIDIRQRGVNGGQADISIRGGSFDQCLILIDGVKFSDPQTGHHMMNIPVLVQDIERIEVLRGSASRIFGQNGFSGAINIITKKDFKKKLQAELIGGQYAYRSGHVALSGETKKKWGNRISLGHTATEGYADNLDLNNFQGLYQSSLPLGKESQLRFMAGMQQKAFGAQYFYTPPAAKFREYEKTLAAFGTLSGQFTRLANLTVNLNWRRHEDEFRLWRDSTHKGVNNHVSYVYSMDANINKKWKYGVSSLGIDLRNEQINSTALDTHQRNIYAVFVEHRFPKHKVLSAVIGTNISFISGYGWVAYPGADLGIRLSALLRLKFSVGRSYRVPTFTDLYYNDAGPSSLGNPNLKPEEAWTYEGGLSFALQNLRASVTGFVRDASSLIDWQKTTPADLTWMSVNVAGITTKGMETNLSYTLKKSLISQVRVAYTYLETDQIQTNQVSRYVYDYLKHQVVASMQFNFSKQLSQTVYYRFMERVSYPAAHVLDTRLNFQSKTWGVWLQWENLTQTKYYQLRNVPMPKTWVRMGISVRL